MTDMLWEQSGQSGKKKSGLPFLLLFIICQSVMRFE